MFRPEIFHTLKNYTRRQFIADITAGVIVGVVALPLAIAFAIASGVSPDKGLITAVVGGFLISALGGSRVSIGGPTGAFVVIIYGIVQQHGTGGLAIATVMAGIMLVVMGLARFGSVIKFIPHPVVVGFTSGIAIIIFSSQIKDFLGLDMGAVPADFIEKITAYSEHITRINPYAAAIGIGSLLIITLWPNVSRKIPGSLIALVASTLVVLVFDLPVDTIGSRFGDIPSTIPAPSLPTVDLATIRDLIGPAATIAMLAAIESLLCAVVADGMIGTRHRSNTELIAQGVANIGSTIFGGIPATGAIARTATNVRSGGRTPVAGMIHAVVLLLIMLFFGSLARLIPLSCLAAVLVVVAYNMSEWRSFRALLRSPRSDVTVLVTTFLLTVIFDLTIAIEVGVVLAVFLFMHRMATVTNVGVVTREFAEDDGEDDPNAIDRRPVPDGVEVYEVNGPFFFGAAHKFEEAMSIVENAPKIRIIRMRKVPAIDSTGIHVLEVVHANCRKQGIAFIISGIHAQPLAALEQSGLLREFGEENVLGGIDDALNRARDILGLPREEKPAGFHPEVLRERQPGAQPPP